MSVTKRPKPIIAPQRTNAGTRLMDNQDTTHRGDGAAAPKRPTTILLPDDLKREAQAYASERGTTLTRLIVDGLRWRISQAD
jgi:hypothetical protein